MAARAKTTTATKRGPAATGVGAGLLAPARRFLRHHAPSPDPRGPRIPLGVGWFLLLIVAVFLRWLLPVVLAATAALAALQTAGRAKEAGRPVQQPLAALGAAGLVGAASVSTSLTGLVLLLFAAAALLLPPGRRPWPFDLDASGTAAWYTLRSGGPVGVALASVVLVQGIDEAALGFLVIAVCAYDAGDYLISAGEPQGRWMGPLAGVAATMVWTLAMAVFDPPPFSGGEPWVVGVVLSLCAPAGQWFASTLLPRPTTRAAALRRVDSWLFAAPAFLVAVWVVL